MIPLNTWYVAAWAHEIADQPFARRICNEPLVFFRDQASGEISALEDKCCHRGVPLSLGKVVPEGIQCGYHGLIHDASGQCVRIPGQDKIPAQAKVRNYPVKEKDEMIWIWMGDAALADESMIVDFPFHNDHEKWPHKHGFFHINANYMLMVDNLMDLTHLGYVHPTTIGGDPNAHVGALMDVTRTDASLKYVRWMLDCVPPPTYAKAGVFIGNIDRWQELEFSPPSNILHWSGAVNVGQGARERNNREGGLSVRLIHCLTPETESSCFYFYAPAGHNQKDPAMVDMLFKQTTTAFDEDKVICEAQQARLDELGPNNLVEIASDATRLHVRRIVKRMAEAESKNGSLTNNQLTDVTI